MWKPLKVIVCLTEKWDIVVASLWTEVAKTASDDVRWS